MPIDPGGYKPVVGVSDLYYALITADSLAAYTAGVPQLLAPLAEVSQEPSVNSEVFYADNAAYDSASAEGETKITISISNLPLETMAEILGRTLDAVTGRMYDNGGTPPDVALGFRSLKSNGSYRYYWFLKGKFELPSEDAKTKTDSVEFQPMELTFTAVATMFQFTIAVGVTDKVKRVVGDEDVTNFDGTGWFTAVQYPAYAAPAVLALSSSTPTDGGSGIAVGADISLVFNNALEDAAIYGVVVVKADGTPVVCVNTLSTNKKTMTVNPTGNLDGGSTYIVAIGVKDIYGQTLNTAINFGTA
jgi:phi13 family phage major tail protein